MIIGFDPGLGDAMPGGWCIMRHGPQCVLAEELPAAGKMVDIASIVRRVTYLLAPHECEPALVVIERQHARPQDGHRSLNVMLPAYGQLIGMCQALQWPLRIVQPKDWKAVILRGTTRDKDASCAHVATTFPAVELHPGRKRKAHDGIADAVCITEWGLQQTDARK